MPKRWCDGGTGRSLTSFKQFLDKIRGLGTPGDVPSTRRFDRRLPGQPGAARNFTGLPQDGGQPAPGAIGQQVLARGQALLWTQGLAVRRRHLREAGALLGLCGLSPAYRSLRDGRVPLWGIGSPLLRESFLLSSPTAFSSSIFAAHFSMHRHTNKRRSTAETAASPP